MVIGSNDQLIMMEMMATFIFMQTENECRLGWRDNRIRDQREVDTDRLAPLHRFPGALHACDACNGTPCPRSFINNIVGILNMCLDFSPYFGDVNSKMLEQVLP